MEQNIVLDNISVYQVLEIDTYKTDCHNKEDIRMPSCKKDNKITTKNIRINENGNM